MTEENDQTVENQTNAPLRISILNQRELVAVILVSLLFSLLIAHFTNVPRQYEKTEIGILLSEIFGALLGLTMTSLAILISMVPSVGKRLLETRAFRRLGRLFAITILTELGTLTVGILFFLFEPSPKAWILTELQVIFAFISIGLILLLIRYLGILFLRVIYKVVKESET